jgi:hypothetical protein
MPTKRIPTMTSVEIKKTVAPKRSRAKSAQSAIVDEEAIARAAYERFVARGMAHGHALEDWLAAEEELRGV